METCTCGQTHHDGANYYVSCVDGPRQALLAGPYKTHAEALSAIEPVRNVAYEFDPKSWFYGFGTMAMKTEYTKPGILNAHLAERLRVQELGKVRINVTGMQGDRNVINPVLTKYLPPTTAEQYTSQFEWSYRQVKDVIDSLSRGRTSKQKTAVIALLEAKLAPFELPQNTSK